MPDSFGAALLKKQGWAGPGAGLDPRKPHARAKPILAFKRSSLAGIGKDRDSHDEWWDKLYSHAARGSPAASQDDYVALAKQDAAKHRLYRGFTKGGSYGGTHTPSVWAGLDLATARRLVKRKQGQNSEKKSGGKKANRA